MLSSGQQCPKPPLWEVCLSQSGVGATRCNGLKGWFELCVTGKGWDVWPYVFYGLLGLYCLCSLPHAVGRGRVCGLYSKGSLKVTFSGLPLATWGYRAREDNYIYIGLSHFIRYFKF